MNNCTHDLSERETACADGMCPLCLADRIAELERQLARRTQKLNDELGNHRPHKGNIADGMPCACRFDENDDNTHECLMHKERREQLAAAERWVSIDDRLPDSNVPVIAFVEAVDGVQGRTRRIRAQYAGKFTLPVSEQCDINDWSEWNEQDDECYCPAGWYETNEFEETNWAVSGTVTHWMPLPEPPSIAATDKEGE